MHSPVSHSQEKRLEHRRAWSRKARADVPGRGEMAVRTHDISEHGLSFFSDLPVPEGSTCSISARFYLHDAIQVLAVSGRVVHCWLSGLQGYRIGIEFRHLDEPARKLLKDILAR